MIKDKTAFHIAIFILLVLIYSVCRWVFKESPSAMSVFTLWYVLGRARQYE